MTRLKAYKRAFFGYYRDNSHPNQNNLTGLLPTEWVTMNIVKQKSWSVPGKEPGSGTAHCEAVLGPPSRRVRPAKSWKQRLENYRFLRSGAIWFMGQTWIPASQPATIVTRTSNDTEINNISECCYEHLILLPGWRATDPAIYTLRCSACEKVHAGRFPNGEEMGQVFLTPTKPPNVPPPPPPPKDTRDGRQP